MMRKILMGALAVAFIATPLFASADALSNLQNLQAQLQQLLAQIASIQSQLNTSTTGASATGSTSSPAVCLTLSENLYAGESDATTNGDVTQLQQYLGVSPTTGYFGSKTVLAVENWQVSNNIASLGTAGYGFVGPRTRVAMGCNIGSITGDSGGSTQSTTFTVTNSAIACPAMAYFCPAGEQDQLGADCSHTCVPSTVTPPSVCMCPVTSSGTTCNCGSVPSPYSTTPSVTFTASPTSVAAGSGATLTWSSKNATSCTGNGFSTSAANGTFSPGGSSGGSTSGSITVYPTQTTTYSIMCKGGLVSAVGSATVTVSAAGGTGGGGTACSMLARVCPTGQIDQVSANCTHTCVASTPTPTPICNCPMTVTLGLGAASCSCGSTGS